VETFLALAVVVGLWSFLALRRRRRDVAAVQALIERLRQDEPSRLTVQARDTLARRNHLQGENVSDHVERLLEGERNFYKYLIHIYLRRDAAALAALPEQVAALVEPYRKLVPTEEAGTATSAPTVTPEPEDTPALRQELNYLRQEHSKLGEHLRTTLDTVRKMIEEYATVFGKDRTFLEQATGDQILEALTKVVGDPSPQTTTPAAVTPIPAAESVTPSEPSKVLPDPESEDPEPSPDSLPDESFQEQEGLSWDDALATQAEAHQPDLVALHDLEEVTSTPTERADLTLDPFTPAADDGTAERIQAMVSAAEESWRELHDGVTSKS
jgi:hypothetical protein